MTLKIDLNPYENDIREMKRQGVPIRTIARVLTDIARVKVSPSAVFRFLKVPTEVPTEQQKNKVIHFTCRQPDEYDRPKRPFTMWQP